MSYEVLILRRAQRELSRTPSGVYERLVNAIRNLADNPRPRRCVKLSGRDGWRIRVGEYRVIYDIDDNERIVTVLHIGHRRDIYR